MIIPNSVTSIGTRAFDGCILLTSMEIPEGITYIDSFFQMCSGLTSVVIPKSVTTISDFAFDECTSLTDVYYHGTQEEWSKITIGKYNEDLLNANVHFLS